MYKISPAAYIFTHVYLNTMQQGIQSLHVIGDMFAEYRDNHFMSSIIYDWATDHKVVRILNAGGGEMYDNSMLQANELADRYNIPFTVFKEPDISGMGMAFGLIVPPQLAYDVEVAQEQRSTFVHDVNMMEPAPPSTGHPLSDFLSSFSSAR